MTINYNSGGGGLDNNTIKKVHLYSYEADPDETFSLLWAILKQQAVFIDDKILTQSAYTDRAVSVRCGVPDGVGAGVAICLGRNNLDGENNLAEDMYFNRVQGNPAAGDYTLAKFVAGVNTNLGTEAANLTVGGNYPVKLSCSGTSIKAYRGEFYQSNVTAVAKITATDSSTASGKYGIDNPGRIWVNATAINTYIDTYMWTARIEPAGSPARKPAKFFNVPIIGSGTEADPYKADIPRGLDYSAVIKSDPKTGKPTNAHAVVRIFEMNRDVFALLSELRAKSSVKELPTMEQAIKEAKKADDLLQDHDFIDRDRRKMQESDFLRMVKDTQTYRHGNMKALQPMNEIAHFLESGKGWKQ